MNDERQDITSIDQMDGWPATPGAHRFKRAAQFFSELDVHILDEPRPETGDPGLAHDTEMVELTYSAMLFDSTEVMQNLPPDIQEGMDHLTGVLESLDTNLTFAGCIFDTDDEVPGMVYPCAIAILSRDPDWMGVSTLLPLLKDKRIILWESPDHPGQLGPFLALAGPTTTNPRPVLPPPPGRPHYSQPWRAWHAAASCEWRPTSTNSALMQSIQNILP